jgi:hypothetical protein
MLHPSHQLYIDRNSTALINPQPQIPHPSLP